MARIKPDELSAEARRWATQAKGPRTPMLSAVLEALRGYYDDLIVVEGIVRWREARPDAP